MLAVKVNISLLPNILKATIVIERVVGQVFLFQSGTIRLLFKGLSYGDNSLLRVTDLLGILPKCVVCMLSFFHICFFPHGLVFFHVHKSFYIFAFRKSISKT